MCGVDSRRAHTSAQVYSKAVAAAARLQDIAGAACREAARQLQLYDPNNIKLLQAAAQASKGASQQQQCMERDVPLSRWQPSVTSAPAHDDADVRQPAAGAGGPPLNCSVQVAAHSTAASAQVAADDATQQHLRDEQEKMLQTALQGLATEHMQRWRQSQGQRDSRDESQAPRSVCWAGLYAAAQQYCSAAARRVSLALEQALEQQRRAAP